ncbi:catalase [Endozoicomonas montiporae]|uniref:Catalase n=2 Tax=Endozoicomonas montiporae TaxID=1027273 RepID=A0A081N8Y5_9GAMM|nr:catalase [Endozoicomonas montiporae]AMO55167.1 catalase [Endozoicomonas montiporae CL-33]KEQ14908.1 catalase [Endozoicomonas montiporae]
MSKTYLTTASGAPVADDNNSVSAGERGSLTFDNVHLFEKLAHFNRERIPERVVHARGYGAYGTFTLNKDLSDYTIADFLKDAGKKTDVFLRFSTVAGGQDSGDYVRDVRGFALRFYTEQGNYDIVGNNTPVFFIRDPAKFPDFIHSQKKDPKTNLPNPAHHFEFWANHPQSMHQITILMSDRGIPKSLRHTNGYGSHTLSLWNKDGERFWVKWHFKTNQGIETLTNEEAEKQPADGMQKDLVEAIDKGDFPSWSVKIQIMTDEQARQCSFNPFDLTKVWPHSEFPLKDIGILELNRNVDNYFAETEQVAFAPSNLVPGVGVSPDKVLQGRLFAYADAHRYRLGVNHQQIPVNKPLCPVHHYQRDGAMAGASGCPVTGHLQNGDVNFYPNDRTDAPAPAAQFGEPSMPLETDAWLKAYDSSDEDNYSQAGNLYRIMSEDRKQQLVSNIAGGLSQATESVQSRMIEHFTRCDEDYGQRIQALLEG